MENEDDGYTNRNLFSHERTGTMTGRLGNKRTSGDHPNFSIRIDYNTGKSPGDLRRVPVTQTPVEDNHVTLV